MNTTISALRPLIFRNGIGISVRPLSRGYRGGQMTIQVPAERIEQTIRIIRGHRVMLDADLADLYHVEVKQLKRQVRRNKDRFPGDFVLELSQEEYRALRSQIGTLKMEGPRRRMPRWSHIATTSNS
jgi:hypothetical protein